MQSGRDGKVIVARLDEGEDLLEGIAKVARREGAHSALVVSGIGMLRDVEIGYWGGADYRVRTVEGPAELLSLLGSVANGTVHLHCVVGMEDHTTRGGHVLSARVAYVNEIVMLALDGISLTREPDGATGMRLLGIEKRPSSMRA